jgi:glycosyltransferase involved in cell wall biosynthesis
LTDAPSSTSHAARFPGTGISVELWLAGKERDGKSEFTELMEAEIAHRGVLEQVRLLGHRTDTLDLLQSADLLLLPSTNEGLPLSLLEAQACGVPVLAAPTSGIPEIVHDSVTGYLIEATDAALYAERIAEFYRDPAQRETSSASTRDGEEKP